MSNKYLFTAIAVVVVLVIGLFIYNRGQNHQSTTNSNNSNVTSQTDVNSNVDANANTNATADSNSEEMSTKPPILEKDKPDGNDVAVFEINFDGKAFSPNQLTVKSGDVVVFNNKSNVDFWPASGPHPQHTNYPEFDPKKAIPAGGSWKFTFTKVGTWPFHDHLMPSVFGSITVK